MLWACFIPLAIIWRSRILLKAMIAVSEAEKKNETSDKKNKKNKIKGKDNMLSILLIYAQLIMDLFLPVFKRPDKCQVCFFFFKYKTCDFPDIFPPDAIYLFDNLV